MNLREAGDRFIDAKEVKNVSEKTLQIYTQMIDEFVEFTGDIPVETLAANHVREFLSYNRKREGRFGPLSDATVHKYYAVVRTFSRWLDSNDYKAFSATEKVETPHVEAKLPEAMTDEEVMRLYRYTKAFCSERVQLIFSFFLDTGARLAEVVRLDVDDVHLDDKWVKVYGKGRRERILPLGSTLRRDLAVYLSTIRPQIAADGEEALFVTQQGTRYTKEGLATLVKIKLKKVNVKGRYGPHKLRHTFATNYLRNNGRVEQLRIVLGHRDISTTQRYLSLVPDDLTKAQDSSSPNDRFQSKV